MKLVCFEATLLVVAGLLASSAEAFWGKGHLLVARRAEEILAEDMQDGVLDAALAELNQLTTSHPDLIEHEKDHPFTECATFADDIKGTFGRFQTQWHFINQPYLDEEGTTVDDFPDFHQPDVDVVQALTDLINFLKGDKEASSTYISQIVSVFPEEADQRSFALRLVIHYLGDIHQPLHAVAEVDSTYPKGDKGGNDQKVPDDGEGDGVDNLHAIWDSVIYSATGYVVLPLEGAAWDEFTSAVDDMHTNHDIDQSLVKPGDYDAWAKESLQLSIDVVYNNFSADELPSEEYKAKALPILEQRIMFGGARLAELMQEVYGKSAADLASEEVFLQ